MNVFFLSPTQEIIKMDSIWTFLQEKLQSGLPNVLITVVQVKGSSPGKVGFMMAVSADGDLSGSVGGGVMEYKMVEKARELIQQGTEQPACIRQVHDPEAGEESSGLICAGEQTHVFTPLNPAALPLINRICRDMVAALKGQLQLTTAGMQYDTADDPTADKLWSFVSDSDWQYVETIGLRPTLSIFGGGHVSLPLSQVFRMLGFRVRVLDDRAGLSTMKRNTYAHELKQIDYKEAAKHVADGADSYVVIMTVSHAADQLILGQMLNKSLKYLGMIGSKNKVKKIFENLLEKGANRNRLEQVDSPIGLPINSRTVEEIAISIAARVIMARNEDVRNGHS